MSADLLTLLGQLDEARAKATPGPWVVGGGDVWTEPEFDLHRFDNMGELVASTKLSDADAALIVAAVNALPELLRLARERYALEAAVLGLAGRHERSARHRRRLATRWMAAERYQLADAFRRLARQSEAEAARIRSTVTAALAGQHTTDEEADAQAPLDDSDTADELAAGLRACCGQPSERHCQ